jgi:hypothetical protein
MFLGYESGRFSTAAGFKTSTRACAPQPFIQGKTIRLPAKQQSALRPRKSNNPVVAKRFRRDILIILNGHGRPDGAAILTAARQFICIL